jgi:transposase
MPGVRTSMRKIREVLRLRESGLTVAEIARSLGIAAGTAWTYATRLNAAGLTWPLPPELDDAALERLVYPPPPHSRMRRPEPDWPAIHRELKRPGVMLLLVWEEYRAAHPNGYGYSRFCQLYRAWEGKLPVTMRQHHLAGEKLFVDYAGQTVAVIDPATATTREAQIFVAVMGASNFTYAEATWTQSLADWIGAHVRAFEFLSGVPHVIVPDNLKAAIVRACLYEPAAAQTFADMAAHYGTAILPARPAKPRDKAKVEAGVLIVERWILARLRNRRFFSLAELNAAIAEELERLNRAKVMRHLGAARQQLFDQVDRPALKPLPAEAYVFAEWRRCRPGLDYHVRIHEHGYSVPFALARTELDARITATTVEVFHKGKRVASHIRRHQRGHSTTPEHMPPAHRRFAEWTPERLRGDAARIGPNTATLIEAVLARGRHPEQGARAALGILRLARSYESERMEAAATRAIAIGALSYTSLASILRTGLDRHQTRTAADGPVILHDNIRGPRYYH